MFWKNHNKLEQSSAISRVFAITGCRIHAVQQGFYQERPQLKDDVETG
jgi:hypothetical protein